jgi:hypothetical protein
LPARPVNEPPDLVIDTPDPARNDDPREAPNASRAREHRMGTRVAHRALRRAAIAAVVLAIGSAALASADTLAPDGDPITPGIQPTTHLGDVAPGATIVVEVPYWLSCSGTAHVNRNQVVTITPLLSSGAGPLAATDITLGPPPATWPLDGDPCTAADTPVASSGTSTVTLTAPALDGEGYLYQVGFIRSYDPVSGDDGSAVNNGPFTFLTLTLDVVSNTAPVLDLPSAITLEGDTTGGALAAYTVGATDAEDDPDPTPVCTPAPGTLVPLGTTQVDCTVTDTGGQTATGSFDLTVVDTTDPTLSGVPAAFDVTTGSTLGATVNYALPTATDVVDPAPTVTCDPASGSLLPIGTTLVGCTATDASGNTTTASFEVTVRYVAARWESPIGGDPAWLVANHGRTVPVKLAMLVSGGEWSSGKVDLVVTSCGGAGALATAPMSWQPDSGRWMGHLDTSLLPGPGCYTSMASPNGSDGPTFRLDLRPAAEQAAPGRAKKA